MRRLVNRRFDLCCKIVCSGACRVKFPPPVHKCFCESEDMLSRRFFSWRKLFHTDLNPKSYEISRVCSTISVRMEVDIVFWGVEDIEALMTER